MQMGSVVEDSAAELGSLECVQHPSGRLAMVACADLPAGALVERCHGKTVPAWQGGEDFLWALGAFPVASTGQCDAESDVQEEVMLPFGWGMLYADASRLGCQSNTIWLVEETEMEQDPSQEEADSNFGRPSCLVIITDRAVKAGEELILQRGWRHAALAATRLNVGDLDICSAALKQLEEHDLSRHEGPETDSENEDARPKEEQERSESQLLPQCQASLGEPAPSRLRHCAASPVSLRARLSAKHGIGVFAERDLQKGVVVEVSPVVVVEDAEVPSYGGTMGRFSHMLTDYTFDARLVAKKITCLPLGFGPLFNYSATPNITQQWAYQEPAADGGEATAFHFCYNFVALRDIEKGEELLLDYGASYWDARGVIPC
eukprot:TRINITY_DN74203_c0_g1_i1.p1 TRINITY_DN74203_c0_g1~~TRINITY_DN74203_c0_g1_i1.p1  ORF type:complete len:376 (-),score=84.86 TRINITY_DN74203_c0_g1_i1:77-1204(-)